MTNFVENSIVTTIEAIKEGKTLLKGFKFRFFVLFILQSLFVAASTIAFFSMIYYPQLSSFLSTNERLTNFHLNISSIPISTLFSYALIIIVLHCFIVFLTAMLEMLAIRKATGSSIKISLVFQECKKTWVKIFVLSVIASLLMLFTFLLEGLPSHLNLLRVTLKIAEFYISIALTFFSLPLIVLKPEISLLTAIKAGIQTMNSKWLSLAMWFLLVMLMAIIGILTLFIAYIWLIPLIYLAYGVIVRDAFQLPKAQRV